MQSTPAAEVVLVVLDDSEPPPRATFRQRLRAYRKNLLYLAYTRLDEWRFRSEGHPFAPVEVSDLLSGVPRLPVRPRKTRFCDYFEEADVERIRDYDVDVAIRLGFRILKGGALNIARFGVWSYHHGDNAVNRGGPPGFWEVAEKSALTGAVLQVLSADLDNGRVIYRSYSATNPYSLSKNLHGYYWKSAAFVPRKLRELHESGSEALNECSRDGYRVYSNRLYQQPTNSEMMRFLPRLAARYTRQKLAEVGTRDQWFLAYKLRRPGTRTPDVPDGTFYNFKVLAPPVDRFWADPFPIVRDGRYYVFFEEYLYATKKAHISVFTVDENGKAGPAQVALQTEHHLSYPTIFEWKGELYMLPEAVDSGRVRAYRCTEFPDRWEPDAILLDQTAGADPTIAKIGERWWLFITLAQPGTDNWDDELHLYFADSPVGPWTAHPRNPVKSDVRGARPAGRVFSYDGRWYRPAQNCSVRYGYGMTIHEIIRVDERHYHEVPVSVVRPEWRPGLLATHTLNAAGDLTVIDGQWRRSLLIRRPPFDRGVGTLTPATRYAGSGNP